MNKLSQKKCEPCEGKTSAFTKSQAQEYLGKVPGWQVDATGKMISREYRTKNFMAAVEFIGRVAALAEADNHHPDIHLTGYRNLRIELSTHAVGGLSENDFILAAKVNELELTEHKRT